MRKTILICTVLTFCFVSLQLSGTDDWLTYSLQMRHRFEKNDKDFIAETRFNNFNLLRSRLGITFTPVKNLEAFFQIQYSRLFGRGYNPFVVGFFNNIDIHQVYLKVKNLFGLPLDLKLGRMKLSYGPERLIGTMDWHNIGRNFDGVVFSLHVKKVSIDFFNMKEIEETKPGDIGDENFLGIYADFKISPKYTTQAFLLWQKMKPSDDLSRFTTGFYIKGKHGKFRHELEFAYQWGKLNPAPRLVLGIFSHLDISAFMAALNLGYNLSKNGVTPDIAFGVDYLSGDGNPVDSKFNVFDTLFATDYKYYGFMDYFTDIPFTTGGRGLIDLHAAFSLKPFKRATAAIKYHIFRASKELPSTHGSTSKVFGNEIDFTFELNYNKHLTFMLGASLFVPGDIFKSPSSGNTSTWLYLMTTFNL